MLILNLIEHWIVIAHNKSYNGKNKDICIALKVTDDEFILLIHVKMPTIFILLLSVKMQIINSTLH